MLGPSAHADTFTRDNLPPLDQWPDFLLDGFDYPEHLNAGVELTDAHGRQGLRRSHGADRQRPPAHLQGAVGLDQPAGPCAGRGSRACRPGNRVLIRSANNPAMVACWLAATKAGAVVVNTMPMLRAGELAQIVDKAEISHALCDTRLMDELVACAKDQPLPEDGGRFRRHRQPRRRARPAGAARSRCASRRSGPGATTWRCLGFTSGTTGEPKATMHFHRDLLIIADGYAREVLEVTPEDVFVGSPPLAFTFGLGGLAMFPLRFGAAAALLETASPPNMIEIIETLPGHRLLHRAHRLPRDAGARWRRAPTSRACGPRSRRARPCRRRSTSSGWPEDRQADARRDRRDRDAAHLHHQPLRRCKARLHRAPGDRLRGANRGRRHAGSAARRGRAPCGARPDRVPLPDRRAADRLCPRRLEHHRRQFLAAMRTGSSTSPPATTT